MLLPVLVGLVSGKYTLADWLFLAAFVVLVVHAVLHYLDVAVPRVAFVSIGVALVALGLMVL